MSSYINRRLQKKGDTNLTYGEPEEKPLDIHEVVNKFLRRKRLFLYIFVPVFLWFAVNSFLRSYSPIFRATFDVGVVNEKPLDAVFPGPGGAELPTVIGSVTQRAITSLLSVNLAEKVIEDLSLFTYVDDGGSDLRVDAIMKKRISEPFGPLRLVIDDVPVSIYRDGSRAEDSVYGLITVFNGDEKIAEGLLDEYIDAGICELRITSVHGKPLNKHYRLMIYPKESLALALRNSLSIKVLDADKIDDGFSGSNIPFSGEGASDPPVVAKSIFPGMNLIGILRIDVHWGNPQDALRIANSLSEQLLMENREEKSQQFTQSKAFIDSQLIISKNLLTDLEEQVRRFKERKSISNLEASTQELISQVSELQSRKSLLEIEQKVMQDLIGYLANPAAFGDTIPDFGMTMLSDVSLRALYSDLLQTEAELKGKLREYSSNHPKVREIQARLDGLVELLNEEVLKRTSAVGSEIDGYNRQIRILQARLDNVPLEEVSLARLERDRETAEKTYLTLSERLQETRVQEAGVTSDLKIINPPMVSSSPVNGRGRIRGVIFAMAIAAFGGALAVLAADYLDNTIKDPDKITNRLGIILLETIPLIGDEKKISEFEHMLNETGLMALWRRVRRNKMNANHPEPLKLLRTDISSPEFESFRKLAVSLDFIHPYKKYRVLYVTSAGPEEGKTFVALNLGQVIGSMGKSILMIDTDFRKTSGHLTAVTKLKKELGLFDILMGSVEPQDVTLPFGSGHRSAARESKSKIDLLPLGKVPPNPFVFLESEAMKKLVASLRKEYDYIIIDGVPLLLFADASYLATFADGVILTARYGRTTLNTLDVANNILISAKSDILGVVLNGAPKERGSYYYDNYYRHYSKYYKTG
ncbi:MAG: AAA family ATPase [candidate division WOR-3 bacterium]|nr:MAG: AAA family ATPase [candidate division WOR-3 bacterium]